MDILIIIFGIIGFIYTIIIHEVSHGIVAERLGDPTARLTGRLTLNPIKHVDILGSILVPLTLFFIKSPILFGWAKPVPVDPYNLQHPKKDMALISLAGPLSNIVMAIVLSVFLRIFLVVFPSNSIITVFFYLIQFNIILAIFNLIPIHPLDGGKIVAGILPERQAKSFNNFLRKYGIIIIFVLLVPFFGGAPLISTIINPIINFATKLLLPIN